MGHVLQGHAVVVKYVEQGHQRGGKWFMLCTVILFMSMSWWEMGDVGAVVDVVSPLLLLSLLLVMLLSSLEMKKGTTRVERSVASCVAVDVVDGFDVVDVDVVVILKKGTAMVEKVFLLVLLLMWWIVLMLLSSLDMKTAPRGWKKVLLLVLLLMW